MYLMQQILLVLWIWLCVLQLNLSAGDRDSKIVMVPIMASQNKVLYFP